jgi:histidine decarboxylase
MMSASVNDAVAVYPQVKGLRAEDFQLPSSGLTQQQRAQALAQLQEYLSVQKSNFLGYQVNEDLDYQADFQEYLNSTLRTVFDGQR